MSCYFRHLGEILSEAGIEVTPGNKREIDQAIHRIVKTTYKNCPETWKKLKQEIISDAQKRQDFVQQMKNAIH